MRCKCAGGWIESRNHIDGHISYWISGHKCCVASICCGKTSCTNTLALNVDIFWILQAIQTFPVLPFIVLTWISSQKSAMHTSVHMLNFPTHEAAPTFRRHSYSCFSLYLLPFAHHPHSPSTSFPRGVVSPSLANFHWRYLNGLCRSITSMHRMPAIPCYLSLFTL